MRKIWLNIVAAVVVLGLGLAIVGCGPSTPSGSDKMKDKMDNKMKDKTDDKMKDKMDDKMKDKMDDKMKDKK